MLSYFPKDCIDHSQNLKIIDLFGLKLIIGKPLLELKKWFTQVLQTMTKGGYAVYKV